jgi:hypothetical protein
MYGTGKKTGYQGYSVGIRGKGDKGSDSLNLLDRQGACVKIGPFYNSQKGHNRWQGARAKG